MSESLGVVKCDPRFDSAQLATAPRAVAKNGHAFTAITTVEDKLDLAHFFVESNRVPIILDRTPQPIAPARWGIGFSVNGHVSIGVSALQQNDER